MPRSWVAGGWRGVAAAVAGVERRKAMAIAIPTQEVTCSVTATIGSSGHRSGSRAGRRHDATTETGSAAASAWVSSVVLEGVRRHVIAVGVEDAAGFDELPRSFALLFGRLALESEQVRLRGDGRVPLHATLDPHDRRGEQRISGNGVHAGGMSLARRCTQASPDGWGHPPRHPHLRPGLRWHETEIVWAARYAPVTSRAWAPRAAPSRAARTARVPSRPRRPPR